MAGHACPSCRLPHVAAPHCPPATTTCSWRRCRTCGLTWDPCTGRGWDRDGKPVVLGETDAET